MLKQYFYNSPLGALTIAMSEDAICRCHWGAEEGSEPLAGRVKDVLDKYFATGILDTVSLDLTGTPFQKKVWQCAMEIPCGTVMTYGELSLKVGCKGGQRSVAQALHRNPIHIFVPCHRIVAAHSIGGYAAGVALKIKLLELETISTGLRLR